MTARDARETAVSLALAAAWPFCAVALSAYGAAVTVAAARRKPAPATARENS